MLYFDHNEYWRAVLEEIKDPETQSVIISSFGVYAGINEHGESMQEKYGYESLMSDILDQSNRLQKFVVLLSEADLIECTPGCKHCKEKYEKTQKRTFAHTERWKNVSWYLTTQHHLKAVIVVKKDKSLVTWSGGRNFTASGWSDLSFKLPQEDGMDLLRHIMKLIREKSVPIA